MYNYKLRFTKKKNIDEISNENAYDLINDYYNTLRSNGQVVGGSDIFENQGSIFVSVVLPTADSLMEVNNSIYVDERIKKVKEFFEIDIVYEGNNIEYDNSCMCDKPSWYYLYNERSLGESPLICGDCLNPVPLYRVPYIRNESDHNRILNWQEAKKAINSLWFYGLWDKFTYGENVLLKSKLNREGRKLCRELEKVLNTPVYYFIYYICWPMDEETKALKGLPLEAPKSCPQCGGEWIDDTKFCKCEKCRLITDSPVWKKERNLL